MASALTISEILERYSGRMIHSAAAFQSISKTNYTKYIQNSSPSPSPQISKSRLESITIPQIYQNESIKRYMSMTRQNSEFTPGNYDNEYFWLKEIEENRYAYGITPTFIEDNGQIVFVDIPDTGLFKYEENIGTLENEKTVYELMAPFDYCYVSDINLDLDVDILNENPFDIDNHLCILEEMTEEPL